MPSVEPAMVAEGAAAGAPSDAADYLELLDTDMRHVLRVHESLGGKPIDACKVAEARTQPALEEAARKIVGSDERTDGAVEVRPEVISGPAGDIPVRLYVPRTPATQHRPIVLYFHGGAFVVGELDDFDATPRALARRLGAIVVSSHYRQAPEHRFPAAHEDAYAAWRWTVDEAGRLGGNPSEVAIVGEGSGGNLAVNVALRGRAEEAPVPLHLVLITPMATMEYDLPSHREYAGSRPLSTADLQWASRKLFRRKTEMADPRIDLLGRDDLAGLPPTTVILAAHDPLRSEGQALSAALRRNGVWVDEAVYDGVTHGFVGLSRIVNKAVFAEGQMARNLMAAFRGPKARAAAEPHIQ